MRHGTCSGVDWRIPENPAEAAILLAVLTESKFVRNHVDNQQGSCHEICDE